MNEKAKEIATIWEEKKSTMRQQLSTEAQEFFDLMLDGKDYYYYYYSSPNDSDHQIISTLITKNNCQTMRELFQNTFLRDIINVAMPSDMQEALLTQADLLTELQYSRGVFRRSAGTKDLSPHIHNALSLLMQFIYFQRYDCSPADYLTNRLPTELLEWKSEDSNSYNLVFAAFLTKNDLLTYQAIEEIILGDNNTTLLNYDIVKGILQSTHRQAHQLLGDLLLAARLQEGVRQMICENMDCGTKEAFLTLFAIIRDNNLIRFSSVKRALCTWIGIFDAYENADRITQKMLLLMDECLQNPTKREEYLQSSDSIQISVALWSIGFYDVSEAVKKIETIWANGKKEQILSAAFYLRSIQYFDVSRELISYALEYKQDLPELIACCLPVFLAEVMKTIREKVFPERGLNFYQQNPDLKPHRISVTDFYQDRQAAEKHYQWFSDILKNTPKKEMSFSPCIFPWNQESYSRSDLIVCLCFTAFLLADESKIKESSTLIKEANTTHRSTITALLLCQPEDPEVRQTLIKLLSDRESYTQNVAISYVNQLQLTKTEYAQIADLLKYKSSQLRINSVHLLYRQSDEDLANTLTFLLSHKKEEMRTGGLDLLLRLSQDQQRQSCFASCKDLICLIKDPTDKERILMDEITGSDQSEAFDIMNQKGFGLYDPDNLFQPPLSKLDTASLTKRFSLSAEKINHLVEKLDQLIAANATKEYKTRYGQVNLLGQHLWPIKEWGDCDTHLSVYPFPELWTSFYEQEIKEPDALLQFYLMAQSHKNCRTENCEKIKPQIEKLFGKATCGQNIRSFEYQSTAATVLTILISTYLDSAYRFAIGCLAANYFVYEIPDDQLIFQGAQPWNTYYLHQHYYFSTLLGWLNEYQNEEEFKQAFYYKYALVQKYQFCSTYFYQLAPSIRDIVAAVDLQAAPKSLIYQWLFDYKGRNEVAQLSAALKNPAAWKNDVLYPQGIEKTTLYDLIEEVYTKVLNTVLAVELKRGDSGTVFSEFCSHLNYIVGTHRLTAILKALGKESLNRSTYDWRHNTSKRDILSRFLRYCYPDPADTVKTLTTQLQNSNITKKRLVEAAMYAPQWIDLIGDYLQIDGFKSGCYYFIAHMNESFDDQTVAIIAKYTPLSQEELQNGAFDMNWFLDAYEKLGAENFELLYQSAKYITSGSKHSRARKYADAVLGKLELGAVQSEIQAKRNKDLLMAYSLIPLKDQENDLLERYLFIQNFLKEAKQFGAQRRASETASGNIALKNLATRIGLDDVMRLSMMMETKMAEEKQDLFAWHSEGEYTLKISVDESGTAKIIIKKGDKLISTVPTVLKKNPYYLQLKEQQKLCKEQYSRTKNMFEQAMEDCSYFTAKELKSACGNRIIKPILETLLFVKETKPKKNSPAMESDNAFYLLREGGFYSCEELMADETATKKNLQGSLRVAHPIDFLHSGKWPDYQQFVFQQQIKQPFKQVFREAYIKTEEELDMEHSLRYAGNQIQPQKTVATLKNRRWIADYESGLQKVYYKENIIVRLYALADWFSPADVEAPTLEWVEFSDRKSFKPLTIKEIPDIVFSEVMRDVDLAVSVAHVGGVDPETSHSTIEMRRAIAQFNLPLFQISNVTFEKNHAIIDGKLGRYSVHLGSGIVHQLGGTQIHVLPVHSQHRGKLFLPFVDEDPKTAEIMSKIILFAQDEKIKDASILNQIQQQNLR